MIYFAGPGGVVPAMHEVARHAEEGKNDTVLAVGLLCLFLLPLLTISVIGFIKWLTNRT